MQIVFKSSFAKVFFLALLAVALGTGASAQAVADVDAVVQKMIDAKTIPAAGVAVVRDGKLKLDDTLGKYVPDVPAKWSGITTTG